MKPALEDPRLDKATKLAKAALHALKANGHRDSCACNLCTAGRLLLSALGALYESTPKPKRATKRKAGQASLFDDKPKK